jgi:predicted ATPase/class 3 adenylate cyclase
MSELFSFGAWVRRRRKALDLTREELAPRVGCSVVTIRRIETDERRPSKQLAARLADCMELGPEERAAFLKAARAELAVDQLAVPAQPPGYAVGEELAEAVWDAEGPALPSGTVTFLFTDVEGSTRLWEIFPAAMPAALARHEAILRQAVAAHEGMVFKTVADSVCAAFARAPAALDAALAIQRAIHAEDWGAIGPLRVRMALHMGTATPRAGNYSGPPLNRVGRILESGHAGQILLSLATAELVREALPPDATLRDLGEHRLKDLARGEHLFQLVVHDLPSTFPPLRSLDSGQTHLPAQLTPMVGREREVGQVSALLRRGDVRFLTLMGPGGIGKTRLALQVAADLFDAFADGVFFVELAPISDPKLVVSAIAKTLGVKDAAGQPLIESLKVHFREKHLLLLLDNFEQVVDAATDVAALLAACPRLTVLVTSRSVLHVTGEHEWAVPPLNLPDLQQLPPLEQLTQYEAVRLFISRAQAANAKFVVTNDTAPAVAEICHRLDGLPLAIELAAARIKLFPPAALLARLDHRLIFLTGGMRDRPTRQQTIRTTIDWSYHLLTEDEQTLFARVSVFVGSCTLEAVEAVCNAGSPLSIEILDGLARLIDHSLMQQQLNERGQTRFRLLEIIREYALELLAVRGERVALQQAHGAYFLQVAERAERELVGSDRAALERLEEEHADLRAALTWWLRPERSNEDAEMGLHLAGALGWFWVQRGYWGEGRGWLERALAANSVGAVMDGLPCTKVVAKGLSSIGFLAWFQGDYTLAHAWLKESVAIWRNVEDRWGLAFALTWLGQATASLHGAAVGRSFAEQGLAYFRELGDEPGMAFVLFILGHQAMELGDNRTARALLEESVALHRQLNAKEFIANTIRHLGTVALRQGDVAAARTAFEESLAISRECGDRLGQALALTTLGDLVRYEGNYQRAKVPYQESLQLFEELGDKGDIARQYHNLGYVALRQGDVQHAHAHFQASLQLFLLMGIKRGIAECLVGLAGVAAALASTHQAAPERREAQSAAVNWRRAESAARLLGSASALRAANDSLMWPADHVEHERIVAEVCALLGESALGMAWAEGRAMTIEQAIAYAVDEGS